MKKIYSKIGSTMLLSAGLTMCLAACSSDDESTNPSKGEKIAWTFEVGNGDVRTMLYPDKDNKVVFKKGDSISVFNNLEAGASTKAGGDKFVAGKAEDFGDGDTASVAKFNGEANISARNFWILYPYQSDASCNASGVITATIPAEQTATAGTFDPKANLSVATTEAHAWDVPKFYLKNAVGLLKFSVDKAYDKVVICGALGEKIAGKVTINAATAEITDKTNATDRIVMSDLVPGKVYYAAVIPQEYKSGISVKFYSGGTLDGRVRVLNPSQILEVKRSKILNVGTVKPEVPKTLTGKFSVSAGKQVIFSPGNLQAIWNGTGYDWSFEERQWDCVGDATKYRDSNGNMHIDGNGKNNLYAMVDLFGWTKSGMYNDGCKQYGINASQTPADYGNSNTDVCCDWGGLITDGNTWLVLTKDEWTHLLNSRTTAAGTASKINGKSDARWMKCNIDGITGLLIFPDTFTWPTGDGAPLESTATNVNTGNDNFTVGYSKTQFTALEKSGVVFLPCSGIRDATTISSVGSYGIYWSSSASVTTFAYRLTFGSYEVSPTYDSSRYFGRSVRLVYSAE